MKTFHKAGVCACLVAASALALVGCDIFDTRDAEAPGTGGTPWKSPTQPVIVFENLESGLEDLTGANYVRSLADAFTFVPLAADVEKFPSNPFGEWTKAVEEEVTERILSDSRSVAVLFDEKTQIRDEADYAEFRAKYELAVTYSRGESDTLKARAQFDFQRVAGNWQLIRWTDQEGVEGFATWGYLRGVTRPPNAM